MAQNLTPPLQDDVIQWEQLSPTVASVEPISSNIPSQGKLSDANIVVTPLQSSSRSSQSRHNASSRLLDLKHWSDLSGRIDTDQSSEQVQKEENEKHFQWQSTYQLIFAALEYDVKVLDATKVKYSGIIGSGANMTVYEGTANGHAVALKRIRSVQGNKKSRLMSLDMEIRVMSDVFLNGHPNIAKLLAFTWEESDDGNDVLPVLVMELAIPGFSTMEHWMQQVDVRDFEAKAYIISDLISGLAAIHDEKIVHGDLKPDNILLFPRLTPSGEFDQTMPYMAKITDFGFCEDIYSAAADDDEDSPDTSSSMAAGGTEYWNAPECFSEAPEDYKPFARKTERDLYSFGLVVWYILSNRLPFGPTGGPEWESNREATRRAKIEGEVYTRYETWFDENLKMCFSEDSQDEIERIRLELDEEKDLPPYAFAERQMIARLRSNPLVATQTTFDELLFRGEGKASWITKMPPPDGTWKACAGYLPVMVPVITRTLFREPWRRMNAKGALPMFKLFPNRKPDKIYNYMSFMLEDNKPPGERQGWQELADRFKRNFLSVRKLQTLPTDMRSALIRQLHRDADGPSPTFTAVFGLYQIYGSGYGVPADPVLSYKYMLQVLEMTKGTKFADDVGSVYVAQYYTKAWFRTVTLDANQELKWSLTLIGNELSGGNEKGNNLDFLAAKLLFQNRLKNALLALNDGKAVKRFFRLATSAYIAHQMIKEDNRSDPILREPYDEDTYAVPEYRGPWVQILLSDNPSAFEAMMDADVLPPELQLWNQGLDSVLMMMMGNASIKERGLSFMQGVLQRANAAENLLRICAEYGLKNLLKHLQEKHNVDINQRLDTGLTALQEVLEQGRVHRAITLLACGADLSVIGEKKFIQHISADGNYKAIDFWNHLRETSNDLVWSGRSEFLLIDHYKQIFNLFGTDGNMDLNKQTYETEADLALKVAPASPIYFSIAGNTWSTFLALLRYKIDPSKPCMGSFDALETSVALHRPLFVATLLGTQYNLKFQKKQQDGRKLSLFHIAALGDSFFTREKKWVYGNKDEIRDDPEELITDAGNHIRVVLELLWQNLTLDIDAKDNFGLTPFLLAVLQANLDAAKWFADHGADVNSTATDGCTALHLAVVSGSKAMFDYIIETTKDQTARENVGLTSLHFACGQSNDEILTTLLNMQPELEAVDLLERNVCLISLDHGQTTVFTTLINKIQETLGTNKLKTMLLAGDSFDRSCCDILGSLNAQILQEMLKDISNAEARIFINGCTNLSDSSTFAVNSKLSDKIATLAPSSCIVRDVSTTDTAQEIVPRIYLPEFREFKREYEVDASNFDELV